MSDNNNDGLNLDDPDRLPWLETADGYEYDDGSSPLKIAGLVLGGLALLALIVGGIYYMQRNQTGAEGGNGELIAAQEGEYKVRPEEAGGKSFEGEGDAAEPHRRSALQKPAIALNLLQKLRQTVQHLLVPALCRWARLAMPLAPIRRGRR